MHISWSMKTTLTWGSTLQRCGCQKLTLVGRRNTTARRLSQAMAVSEEEMASAFRSELHSSRSSLFSFPGWVGGLDGPTAHQLLTGGTIGWLIWQSKAIRAAGWGDRRGRASEQEEDKEGGGRACRTEGTGAQWFKWSLGKYIKVGLTGGQVGGREEVNAGTITWFTPRLFVIRRLL